MYTYLPIYLPTYDQDEVIDVIEGNRKYIRCLYAYNKVSQRSRMCDHACAHLPQGLTLTDYK